jgi:hypothetical protein
LEQVHVRGIFRRASRLELVRGLGIALAMAALLAAASHAQSVNTTTTLTEQPSASATCSLTTVTVDVTANAGVPAGSVSIVDEAGSAPVQLASAALSPSSQANSSQANLVFALANGAHALKAVYAGDATFDGSASAPASLTVSSQCDSEFVVSVSDLAVSNLAAATTSATTLTLTPGQTGTGTVTITPLQEYVSTLTAPAFVTISCAGLPDLANCAFTPENVELLPGQNAGVTSSMVIQTYAASSTFLSPASQPGSRSNPIAWAFLLPGALGLGGLAWGTRRRLWLSRLALVGLLGLVTLLGTAGCNPRYGYEHHGPTHNPATPAGTYTLTVAAQSNNGISAVTNKTSFVLTVK